MFAAMRMFKEIKIMVDCLAGSLSIFIFCCLMLSLFLSLFAVFFVQGLATYLQTNGDSVDPEQRAVLVEQWGSVGDALLSLFICATGGDDWRIYYDIIKVIGPQYNYLFLFFISFYLFAFVNVVVGVFCEKAATLAAPTTSELMSKRYEKEFRDAHELFDLLDRHMADEGFGKIINADKFQHFIADPEVEKYFEVRGLKTSSATRFFKMLCDLNQTDSVDYAKFVSAVVLLDGGASCIDLHVMSVRQLHGLHRLHEVMETRHSQLLASHKASRERLDQLGGCQTLSASPSPRAIGEAHFGTIEANLGTQLSSIEAEIKELKLMAASPISSREPSRLDPHEMSRTMTDPHFWDANNIASRDLSRASTVKDIDSGFDGPVASDGIAQKLNSPRFPKNGITSEPFSNGHGFHGGVLDVSAHHDEIQSYQEKVSVLEERLAAALTGKQESQKSEKVAQLEEALAKAEMDLETTKMKSEQLQRLVKLQDAREAELQRQLVQLRNGQNSELAKLERSRADVMEQARIHERRASELQTELTALMISSDKRDGSLFGNMCGTPRTKDYQMIPR